MDQRAGSSPRVAFFLRAPCRFPPGPLAPHGRGNARGGTHRGSALAHPIARGVRAGGTRPGEKSSGLGSFPDRPLVHPGVSDGDGTLDPSQARPGQQVGPQQNLSHPDQSQLGHGSRPLVEGGASRSKKHQRRRPTRNLTREGNEYGGPLKGVTVAKAATEPEFAGASSQGNGQNGVRPQATIGDEPGATGQGESGPDRAEHRCSHRNMGEVVVLPGMHSVSLLPRERSGVPNPRLKRWSRC